MRNLTSRFFHEGLQNKFPEKIKNKEGQWENMDPSCILNPLPQ
jgi:hypothetical protein